MPYPSYQGDTCMTIDASRDVVWSVLTSPEKAGDWLLADLDDVTALKARYRRGAAAAKGDVLEISADTKDGPRKIEITVLAAVPGQLLALTVTKDDEVISPGVAHLTFTFVLEEVQPGKTDLYWAMHYDSDSPLAAALSPIGSKRRYKSRVERGMLALWGLCEATELLPQLPPIPPAAPRASPTHAPEKRPRKRTVY